MLDKSSIVGSIIEGTFDCKVDKYEINGNFRDFLYFLVDGIYPSWAIFIKTFYEPITEMEKRFSRHQEFSRKDIERVFGQLVQQFGVLKQPIRYWYLDEIQDLLKCCVILHNMIVTARRSTYLPELQQMHVPDPHVEQIDDAADDAQQPGFFLFAHEAFDDFDIRQEVTTQLALRVAELSREMQNEAEHVRLCNDLMEHIWSNTHY